MKWKALEIKDKIKRIKREEQERAKLGRSKIEAQKDPLKRQEYEITLALFENKIPRKSILDRIRERLVFKKANPKMPELPVELSQQDRILQRKLKELELVEDRLEKLIRA